MECLNYIVLRQFLLTYKTRDLSCSCYRWKNVGASGKIPAAIHVFPEAVNGGNIGRIKNGDIITLDATSGKLEVKEEISNRAPFSTASKANPNSFGRSLFAQMRPIC